MTQQNNNPTAAVSQNDRIEYRGWTIVRFEDDFEHGFEVFDNNGWRVVAPDRIALRTVRMAKNMIDRYFKAREGRTL